MDPKIIYETKDFLVINKPAGLVIHHAALRHDVERRTEPTLTDWLVQHYPEVRSVGDDSEHRPGIVHRLDKETSGVLIIPRTSAAFEHFKKEFQEHRVIKHYLALVFGAVPDNKGIINKPIGVKSGTIKRTVRAKNMKMVKDAVTEYAVQSRPHINDHDYTLLEVIPRTGRTHQIRVHLASIDHPVMGDKLYGGQRTLMPGLNRHFLHAHEIEFTAPSGERMRFTADLPPELQAVLDAAR